MVVGKRVDKLWKRYKTYQTQTDKYCDRLLRIHAFMCLENTAAWTEVETPLQCPHGFSADGTAMVARRRQVWMHCWQWMRKSC